MSLLTWLFRFFVGCHSLRRERLDSIIRFRFWLVSLLSLSLALKWPWVFQYCWFKCENVTCEYFNINALRNEWSKNERIASNIRSKRRENNNCCCMLNSIFKCVWFVVRDCSFYLLPFIMLWSWMHVVANNLMVPIRNYRRHLLCRFVSWLPQQASHFNCESLHKKYGPRIDQNCQLFVE